ncbi:hypothetical protein HDV64DRAFT_277473 [Trichoderma sp. TUCIM 5745]
MGLAVTASARTGLSPFQCFLSDLCCYCLEWRGDQTGDGGSSTDSRRDGSNAIPALGQLEGQAGETVSLRKRFREGAFRSPDYSGRGPGGTLTRREFLAVGTLRWPLEEILPPQEEQQQQQHAAELARERQTRGGRRDAGAGDCGGASAAASSGGHIGRGRDGRLSLREVMGFRTRLSLSLVEEEPLPPQQQQQQQQQQPQQPQPQPQQLLQQEVALAAIQKELRGREARLNLQSQARIRADLEREYQERARVVRESGHQQQQQQEEMEGVEGEEEKLEVPQGGDVWDGVGPKASE